MEEDLQSVPVDFSNRAPQAQTSDIQKQNLFKIFSQFLKVE